MKRILVSLIVLSICAFLEIPVYAAQPETVDVNGNSTPVYTMQSLDSEPEYPGGLNGLMQFLCENIHYPAKAVEDCIQGRVVVKFVVTTDGDVANVEVVRGVDPLLDAEAVRVVKRLNGFTPGVLNGKKVNVWYLLPVTFRM